VKTRPVRSWLAGAKAAVRRYARDVWACDRAALGGWPALRNRGLRIGIWTVRGVFAHKLSLHAAALTYYTVFSIVPVLVVVVWALNAFHVLPRLFSASARLWQTFSASSPHDADPVLRSAVQKLLTAAERANRVPFGIAGLVALLFAAAKLFRQVSRAIDAIASSSDRRPVYWRMLGYFALLLLPVALLLIAGAVTALSQITEQTSVGVALSRLLRAAPQLRSAAGALTGIAVFALTIATFYSSAARARLGFASAAIGGLGAAIGLVVVTWAFTRFQIGVTKASLLASGAAALPVFLLWTFTSWFIVLVGAEIAVGHDLDRTMSHGARLWKLRPVSEQAAGAGMMVALARRARPATAQELARELRILPTAVRALAARLVGAGLLRRTGAGGLVLACDPESTTLGDVIDAVSGRSDVDGGHWALSAVLGQGHIPHSGPSLRELAEAR
jgi:membrane protein